MSVYGSVPDACAKKITGINKSQGMVCVIGNEGNGISQKIRELVTHPLLIPSYPANLPTSESLNVSIATAIVLAEFRRHNNNV